LTLSVLQCGHVRCDLVKVRGRESVRLRSGGFRCDTRRTIRSAKVRVVPQQTEDAVVDGAVVAGEGGRVSGREIERRGGEVGVAPVVAEEVAAPGLARHDVVRPPLAVDHLHACTVIGSDGWTTAPR